VVVRVLWLAEVGEEGVTPSEFRLRAQEAKAPLSPGPSPTAMKRCGARGEREDNRLKDKKGGAE